MSEPSPYAPSPKAPGRDLPAASGIRVWPGLVLVALYWAFYISLMFRETMISTNFLSNVAAIGLLLLSFTLWWLTNGTISWRERWTTMLVAVAAAAITMTLTAHTFQPIGALLTALPYMFLFWALWLLIARRIEQRPRRIGLAVAIVLAWAPLLALRMDGLYGNLLPQLHLRWNPTPEEEFLASHDQTVAPKDETAQLPPVVLQEGDWPEMRGPDHAGEVRNLKIGIDWNAHPPKLLWKQKVGPAWSSVVVVDGRLFTQEQRGPVEAVVCREAATGKELWVHEDQERYWDSQAGAGPRTTPTFADGKLYTLGATGILNCLDAATGRKIWQRDLRTDAGITAPMWGFSSSPLVANGTVIVHAGGSAEKALIAYRADSGELAWTAAAGPMSYSTVQLVSLNGATQGLILTDKGVTSVEPATGHALWKYESKGAGSWRVVQPRKLGDADVLIGAEDLGLVRLKVAHEADTWTAEPEWISNAMRPAYNDLVVVDNHAYGFDAGIFCCVELASGKRKWKAGRYGHGQVLLLVDQKLLLVTTERGEVVLLAADPKRHEELAQISAIQGKTWNHPAIAHGHLYVRNDEEMACFELPVAAAEETR